MNKYGVSVLLLAFCLPSLKSAPSEGKGSDFDRIESISLSTSYTDVYHSLLRKYDAQQIERRHWSVDGMEQGRAILLHLPQEKKSLHLDFIDDELVRAFWLQIRPDGFEEAERMRKDWTKLYGEPQMMQLDATAAAGPVSWTAIWSDGRVRRTLAPYMVHEVRRGLSISVVLVEHDREGPHSGRYY